MTQDSSPEGDPLPANSTTPSESSGVSSGQPQPAPPSESNTATGVPSASATLLTPTEPPQVTRQKYEEAKLELQALLGRKKQVEENLVTVENAIYMFEGSYLEDTQHNGNIIRGFDGYLTNRPNKRKQKFTELDRLFSLSSSTYQKALALKDERDQESSKDDHSTHSSVSSLGVRKDKKRKLKISDGSLLHERRQPGSAGRDSDDGYDI